MRSIVGTWKLVAAAARDHSGNPLPAPYGGKGMGRVVFNAEGLAATIRLTGRGSSPGWMPHRTPTVSAATRCARSASTETA